MGYHFRGVKIILFEDGLIIYTNGLYFEIDIESIALNIKRNCLNCDLKYLDICKFTKCREFNSHYKLKNKKNVYII